ncbi:hypothetical protein ACQEVB_07095 [Pseudonocardia sp. CA-107938]|uniref:hypothetical protein n=1 Tax=Pseudonocardia sp. CA-107938 TaxID=3240021 RepID=UPI003D94CCDD
MTSASWAAANQRQRLIAAVLADVAATGDADAVHRHPVAETLGDLDTLLLAVHALWSTAVLARADDVLERDPPDPADALAAQLRELDTARPGIRLLLDGHAERPLLAAAQRRLRSRIRTDLGVDLVELPPAPRRKWLRAG